MYYRVVYYTKTTVDGKEVSKRHRLNFSDLQEATNEAEAKASWLSRLDGDALQFSGRDRHIYARALDAVKELDVPLDTVASECAGASALNSIPCRPLNCAGWSKVRLHRSLTLTNGRS